MDAELAERFASVWNERDDGARARQIRELWAEEAVHMLQPPEEVVARAQSLRMSSVFEVRGHAALEQRVRRAYEEFVAPGEYRFRARANAARIHDVVKFNWEMVRLADGAVVSVGLEILKLTADNRILADYQFIETV